MNQDWKKGDPERRQAPVTQSWLIGIMTAVIGALLSIGYMNVLDQQKLHSIEIQDHGGRIQRLEENKGEVLRRLENIDLKLDKIVGWSKG